MSTLLEMPIAGSYGAMNGLNASGYALVVNKKILLKSISVQLNGVGTKAVPFVADESNPTVNLATGSTVTSTVNNEKKTIPLITPVTLEAGKRYLIGAAKSGAATLYLTTGTFSGSDPVVVNGISADIQNIYNGETSVTGVFSIDVNTFYGLNHYTYLKLDVDVFNNSPSLNITSPANNQTLAEGSSYLLDGIATDTDSGNVLTIKYKINNGPPQALQSGVSDGSTPLSFAKTLTYSNKRMRDGSTDVTGVDLAENIDHTLTVWAEDDQGSKSTEEIRKFRVIHNRAPSISDENRELGSISTIPSITYTVSDPEQNSFTITEKINGNTIRTFSGVANQQETIIIPASQWLRLEPGVPHTLTITAADDSGLSSNRVFTFTRVVNQILFEGLETPMETDIAAERILLTPDWTIPLGAEVRVEACNNGFDAEPTWEDCTIPAKMGRGFAFLNTVKTAEKWGVNFRVRIAKGTSTSEASFSGIGGAYDVQ